MKGTGRLRWFGPLLASRVSGKIFTNRTGEVETVDESTCLNSERGYLDDAVCWLREVRP